MSKIGKCQLHGYFLVNLIAREYHYVHIKNIHLGEERQGVAEYPKCTYTF